MTTRPNGVLSAIYSIYLTSLALAVVGLIIGMIFDFSIIGVIFDFVTDELPHWIGFPALVFGVAALVGARINKRWKEIGRTFLIGFATLFFAAGTSWIMSKMPTIPGETKVSAVNQSLSLMSSTVRIYAGGYVAILFAIAAWIAWKPEKAKAVYKG
jgi:hypothetical protein